MKNNYKKGFSLAEVLIIFLLLSLMLTIFAPIITKSSRNAENKRDTLGCVGGVKNLSVEFTVTGDHQFTAPENIYGNATITLVGGGGKGADGDIVVTRDANGYITNINYVTGGGGGGGAYSQLSNALTPGQAYTITVGAGGRPGVVIKSVDGTGADTMLTPCPTNNLNDCTASGGTAGVASTGGVGVVACEPNQDGQTCGVAGQNGEGGTSGSTDVSGISTMTWTNSFGKGGGISISSDPNSTPYEAELSGKPCILGSSDCKYHGKPGVKYEQITINGYTLDFIPGLGGGGGTFAADSQNAEVGKGGVGGDGYARIDYQVRCE